MLKVQFLVGVWVKSLGLLTLSMLLVFPHLAAAGPLDTWNLRNAITANHLRGVAYGNNTFVAVGDGGVIRTSLDGASWSPAVSPTANRLYGICFGKNMFVAVGENFTIVTSNNGVSWQSANTAPPAPVPTLYNVAYGNGMFMAVGSNGQSVQSTDGANWMANQVGALWPAPDLRGVSYGEGYFVAVGSNGTMFRYGGGAPGWQQDRPCNQWSWTCESLLNDIYYDLNGVAYGDNSFVAVGQFGQRIYADLKASANWWGQSVFYWVPGGWAPETLMAIAYGNGAFVAVDAVGSIQTLQDMRNWKTRAVTNANRLNGVAYGYNSFVTVGDNGTILQSNSLTIPVPDSRVVGRILDATTFTGISNPIITVIDASGQSVSAYADSTGSYSIPLVFPLASAGSFSVRADVVGYVPLATDASNNMVLSPASPNALFDTSGNMGAKRIGIYMVPSAEVRKFFVGGMVRDIQDYHPISGATVRIYDSSGNYLKSAVTNNSGLYATFLPTWGGYKLRFSKDGYIPYAAVPFDGSGNLMVNPIVPVDASSPQSVRAVNAFMTANTVDTTKHYIYGQMRDVATLEVIPGASLEISSNDPSHNVTARTATTNDYGAFLVESPGAGFKFWANKKGYKMFTGYKMFPGSTDASSNVIVNVISSGIVDVSPNMDVNLDIYLAKYEEPSYSISGTVKDLVSQDGIQGATVSITDVATGGVVQTATSGSTGGFSVAIALPGIYSVKAVKAGYDMSLMAQPISLNEALPESITEIFMEPSGSGYYYVPLSAGWNFISIPVQPSSTAIGVVLNEVSPNVRVVWGYDNQNKNWLKYAPSDPTSGLQTIMGGKGYWIYMNSADVLLVTGSDASGPITLYEGWNLVGYSGIDAFNVDAKLAGSSMTGKWVVLWNWQDNTWKLKHSIIPAAILPYQEVIQLFRGKAYWIKIKPGQSADWAQ